MSRKNLAVRNMTSYLAYTKQDPRGWNVKPNSMCLDCFRSHRRRQRRNLGTYGAGPQAHSPSATTTSHFGMVAAEQQAQLDRTSSPSPDYKQTRFAPHEVFTNSKRSTSNMREHSRVQVAILLDEPLSPVVAKNSSAIADTGAQAYVWSLREYLQAGFRREHLTPASDLLAANHSPIPIAGTFPAIMEGTTDGSPTVRCCTIIYVSGAVDTLYLSQDTLFALGVVSSNFPTIGEHSHTGTEGILTPSVDFIRSANGGCATPSKQKSSLLVPPAIRRTIATHDTPFPVHAWEQLENEGMATSEIRIIHLQYLPTPSSALHGRASHRNSCWSGCNIWCNPHAGFYSAPLARKSAWRSFSWWSPRNPGESIPWWTNTMVSPYGNNA